MELGFVYSRWMQLIVAAEAYVTNIAFMYFISNVLLTISSEHATRRQKLSFAFWVGAICHTTFVYAIYLIGGAVSFSPIVFTLVVNPNPILGCLYYVIAIKVLKLSPIRSIKLMGYFFMFFIFISDLNFLLIAVIPVELVPHQNFLHEALRHALYTAVVISLCSLMQYIVKKTNWSLKLSDSFFINLKNEKIIYVAKITFLYALTTLLPMLIPDQVLSSAIVLFVVILFVALNIIFDLFTISKKELENRNVHINALFKGVNEFGSIKHDFYNILQTYNGYLEMGDLENLKKYHTSLLNLTTRAGDSFDLGRRMIENPAFISLLLNKVEYAEKSNVNMRIALQCSSDTFFIDNMDVCRCVACLLDNAIEAAATSAQKKVFFMLQPKPEGSKLIIVTNNTSEPIDVAQLLLTPSSSKPGHPGIGLYNIRKALEKYGNCTFQMAYHDLELSAYIELKPA